MSTEEQQHWTPMTWMLFIERWKVLWAVLCRGAAGADTEPTTRSMWRQINGECLTAIHRIQGGEMPTDPAKEHS